MMSHGELLHRLLLGIVVIIDERWESKELLIFFSLPLRSHFF